MSTRGCIARVTPKGFSGRYHHFDSYPTGLAKALWHICHRHFDGDVKAMLRMLINDHPGGWSTVVGSGADKCADFTQEPGYLEYHSLPKDRESEEYQRLRNKPACYCHGDRHEKDNWRINQDNIEGDIEYVYAFDRKGRMQVLSWTDEGLVMFDLIDLSGEEPDWQAIEDRIDIAQRGETKAQYVARRDAERKAREQAAA